MHTDAIEIPQTKARMSSACIRDIVLYDSIVDYGRGVVGVSLKSFAFCNSIGIFQVMVQEWKAAIRLVR